MSRNDQIRGARLEVIALAREHELSKSEFRMKFPGYSQKLIDWMNAEDFYVCKYADPECFIDEIMKSGLPKQHSFEHSKLCVAVHEQGTSEFKADSRIRSFIEFGDFQPRPDAVPPPPDEGPPTLKMFFEVNQEMCGGANEAAFDLCRSVWCSDNDCSGEAETYGDFVARQ
jgi:hypothetical protein